MSVYKDFKHLNALSISDRVLNFKETATEMIKKGESIEELKKVAMLFEDKERYEAAQGVLLAIKESQKET